MTAASIINSPAETLPEEQQAIRTLIGLLQQEQDLLIRADIDDLPLLTERKAPVLALAATLAVRRHRSLTACGQAASEAGMQSWITLHSQGSPEGTTLLSDWTDLLALARQAQEINRVNGMLIHTHMARNQSALNVLRVQTSGGNFYGPDGQASPPSKGRGLALG